MVDIATRVHNHKWKIDPIVRSLIDTDFYKLLMCQSVFRHRRDTQVTFSLINRTKSVRLAELIDEALTALLARYRSAEIDAAYVAAYAAHPLDEADEWGDLASFRTAAGAT